MATTDFCDGDYLGAYRRFLEHFVANVCREDQLPVKMSRRDVRECELAGDIADITLQHLNQRICPPSLQAYLVKLVKEEFDLMFQKQPEECGYRPQSKAFTPLKLMQVVTSKVNEICQRYLDNSRLALLPPPPSIPLPLVSSHAIKNRRRKMEDRSVVLHDLHTMFSIKNDAVVNYYAVFDGHGGQEAATYSAAHLHQYLLESRHYPHDLELALRDAFRTTDARFLECDDTKNSGATAVCCVVYNKTLYIAWAGDSQAALIKNGRGVNLTVPHTPERPDEKARIERLGGEVIYYGTWRVNGVLNVSRSIGDSSFKPYVTEEPEIAKIQLDGTEDFLIIACDGFWEKATEEIVASLLYEYVSSNQSDYNSASEALVLWAKQNLSEDNISVIVVFLTPAAEIRAKHFYNPRPSVAMEPPQSEQQLLDSQPFDFGFVAAKTNGNAIDNNEDPYAAASLLEPMNGRHRPKPPKYNDDDDDDDEEEEEDDLGPETNVDVESHEDFGKLDQAMGQNYPDEFLIKMPAAVDVEKREDVVMQEFQIDNKQSELVAEADNVADSEESEDEWNYYRPEDKQQSESSSKPDRCEEERDICSPLESQPIQQQSPEPSVVLVAEDNIEETRPHSSSGTDDVTAEYDEIHENEIAEKEQEPATLLLIEPSTLDKKDVEVEPEVVAAAEAVLPEDAAPEPHQQPEHEPFEQQQQEEDEDMESSHLNPDAEEFVPSSPGSPSPSMASQQLTQMSSDLVAGSPLKQNQRALKNRQIPSEEEFQEEICRRPSEIDDEVAAAAADFSFTSEASPVSNDKTSASMFGGFEDERQKTVLSGLNLDESEVSSTKAEFGDESSYSVASEFYKTGVDCSYTGSERGIEFDAMATSMTPSDFKQAFEQQQEEEQVEEEEQEPDLNKVHELKDEDLLGVNEIQNGVHQEEEQEKEEKQPEIEQKVPFVDEFMKDVESFEELEQQQNVRVEAFSAMVEERVSTYDNDDLLMNMRNAEQSKDELPQQQQQQEQEPEVSTFSNPFTTVETIQNLTEEMKKVDLELDMEVDEKPQQNAAPVMMNPLDLNFGGAPVEPKADEAIIVSPVKEPEIMSSKFEEENLISRSTEALAMRDEFKTEGTVEAFADEPNHVDDFDPLSEQLATKVEDVVEDVVEKMHVEVEHEVKPINLSESLQEFTGLEEQLSPQSHEVKDNMCFEEVAPTLKESLVDEPKDVEEPPVVPPFAAEAKDDVPLLSNEVPETVTAPVAAVAATAAAAAAVTTAVAAAAAAKTSKPSPATKTAAKPTAISKIGAKTSPTSPAKPGVAAKAPAPAAKKAPLAAAPKPKPAPAAAPKPAASSLTRTASATAKATATATKTATSSAAKPAPRTGTAPAAPKPKLGGVTSKIGSLSADKKPTANGDVKPAAAKPTPSARSLSKPAASSTAPKSSLVKTSTTSRASMGGTGSAAAPKPRPTSSATTKPPTSATSRLSTSGVSSSTPARPKTAPATSAVATATAKSKIGTKSPMIDKQIKETANKQISSARASATAAGPKARATATAIATSTTTTKRTSLAPKPNASPAKKPLNSAATKTAAKTSVTSKVNSKVSSTTKTSANGNAAPKNEVVQNGICQSDESKISTTTTTTTNIEEDIPMKDVSPIEQVTDNQLIITAE